MTDKRIIQPCPFCKEKAENIQIKPIRANREGLYKVYCPNCKATFEEWNNKQTAIDLWNRRWA